LILAVSSTQKLPKAGGVYVNIPVVSSYAKPPLPLAAASVPIERSVYNKPPKTAS